MKLGRSDGTSFSCAAGSDPGGGRRVVLDHQSAYAGLVDERDKRRVGEQVEPGGRPKAPGRLELLQRFVNSYNHDLPRDWDRIGTPRRAEAWLREKRLVG